VPQGGSTNSIFAFDLSSLSTWPTTDTALTLLTDANRLATNLDTVTNPNSLFPSMFSYYTASADGSHIVSLTADLTAIGVSTPEPASLPLLVSSMLGLATARRRHA